jgi:hypothetical protein
LLLCDFEIKALKELQRNMKVSGVLIVLVSCIVVFAQSLQFDMNERLAHYQSSRTIQFQKTTIDTTSASVQSQIRSVGQSTDGNELWVVQVKAGSIQDRIKRDIALVVGHPLTAYVPDNAYIVRTSASNALLLSELQGVVAVVPYSPSLRVASDLATQGLCPAITTMSTTETDASGSLVVHLLPGQAADAAAAVRLATDWASRFYGAAASDSSTDLVALRVPCSRAAAAVAFLSAQPEAVWVERAPDNRVLNYNARGIMQSGGGPTATPIWTKGIDGVGEVVGCVAARVAVAALSHGGSVRTARRTPGWTCRCATSRTPRTRRSPTTRSTWRTARYRRAAAAADVLTRTGCVLRAAGGPGRDDGRARHARGRLRDGPVPQRLLARGACSRHRGGNELTVTGRRPTTTAWRAGPSCGSRVCGHPRASVPARG